MFWRRSSPPPETSTPTGGTSEAAEAPSRAVQVDIEETLKLCYKERAEILLMMGNPPTINAGRICRVGMSTLTLEMPDYKPTCALVSGHICGAVFHLGPRSGGFLAAVREVRYDCEPPQLVLKRPDAVMMVDARRSFRIPVVPSDGLGVQIEAAEGVWDCPVSDLSRNGVGLRSPEGVTFCPGEMLRISLLYDEMVLSIEGLVARQTGRNLGVSFQVDQDSDHAQRLSALVASVERSWLKRDVKLAGVAPQMSHGARRKAG